MKPIAQKAPHPDTRRSILSRRFPEWSPRTVSQHFDEMVKSYKHSPFVIFEEQTYSYQDIQAWSYQLASGLSAQGIGKNDNVAVIMANYPEFIALRIALSRIGAVCVPINFLLKEDEISYILLQSDCKMLVSMSHFAERDYLEGFDNIMPDWESQAGGEKFPNLEKIVIFPTTDTCRKGILHLTELQTYGEANGHQPIVTSEKTIDANSPVDIIYTSGTTGQPKGVLLTHDMVLRAAYSSCFHSAFTDGWRILFSLPMYHVFGYVECLLAATFVGGAVNPHLSFKPEAMIESAEKHQITEIICVPFMTGKMLDVVRSRGFDSRHLITYFNSGGFCPRSIWEDIRTFFKPQEILVGYGMSETTASIVCTAPEEDDKYLYTTNGKNKFAGAAGDPSLNGLLSQFKTVDPSTGDETPPGEPGELLVKGPIVTQGYYNKPTETREAFTADGWLHTGDIGVISEEGYFSLTGRIKEAYRCGSEMVMPKEIEELLEQHPDVQRALVVGLPDIKMGEVGCACVIPKPNTSLDSDALIELCRSRLAKFKVPKYVVYIEESEIPVTATARPKKFELAEIMSKKLSLNV